MGQFSAFLLRAALVAATVAGAVSMGAANAAPVTIAPLDPSVVPMVEKAYWTQRCWWVRTQWGPQQQCRQVWVWLAPPPPLPVPLPVPPPPGWW